MATGTYRYAENKVASLFQRLIRWNPLDLADYASDIGRIR